MRVLIADADEKFRNELVAVLSKEFEEIEAVADGEKVLQSFRNNYPDVLILDLLLPRYDGITVLDRISDIQPAYKVFVVTGFISDYILSALEKRKIFNLAKNRVLQYLLQIGLRMCYKRLTDCEWIAFVMC